MLTWWWYRWAGCNFLFFDSNKLVSFPMVMPNINTRRCRVKNKTRWWKINRCFCKSMSYCITLSPTKSHWKAGIMQPNSVASSFLFIRLSTKDLQSDSKMTLWSCKSWTHVMASNKANASPSWTISWGLIHFVLEGFEATKLIPKTHSQTCQIFIFICKKSFFSITIYEAGWRWLPDSMKINQHQRCAYVVTFESSALTKFCYVLRWLNLRR